MLTDDTLRFVQQEKNQAMDFVSQVHTHDTAGDPPPADDSFESQLEAALQEENQFEQFMAERRSSNKKLYLFGAGLCGHAYAAALERHHVRVAGVIDNYKDTCATVRGIPIVRLEAVIKENGIEDCVFLIAAPGSQKSIRQQLSCIAAFGQVYQFAASRYALSTNEWNQTRDYISAHREDLKHIYDRLGDSQSKKVLLGVLRGLMTANLEDFESVKTGGIYFPPDIIQWGEREIIVDLGANTGDTLRDFTTCCPDFEKIYCFEPDQSCHNALQDSASPYGDRVILIKKAAWSEKGKIGFQSDGGNGSSNVTSEGLFLIDTATVDTTVSEAVTYMKLDVEGSELQALRGAKRQIEKNKPKLAICVYHKNPDIVEIPQYILSIRPDYQVYLRHHGQDDTETVLYAV